MIMLPSHGQDTAAVNKYTGQKLPLKFSRGYVFDKQTRKKFAEFLILNYFSFTLYMTFFFIVIFKKINTNFNIIFKIL